MVVTGALIAAAGGVIQGAQNKKVAEEQRKLQLQALSAYTESLREQQGLNALALQQLTKARGLALDANTQAQGAISSNAIIASRQTERAVDRAVDDTAARFSRTGLGGSTVRAQLQERAAQDAADRTSETQLGAGRALAQLLSQRAGIEVQTGAGIAGQYNFQGQTAVQGGQGLSNLLGQFQPVADQSIAPAFGQIGGAIASQSLLQEYLKNRTGSNPTGATSGVNPFLATSF